MYSLIGDIGNTITIKGTRYILINETNVSGRIKLGSNSNNTTLFSHNSASNLSLTLPPNTGTDGYFLKTDGSGNLTWNTIGTTNVPAANNSTGTKGEIRYDSSHIYVCVETNTWKRIAYDSW